MRKNLLTLSMVISGIIGISAQKSYEVTNSVILKNIDCQLTKTSLILPVPQSNCYQTISNLSYSNGDILDINNSNNKYLREIKETNMPAQGENSYLSETFNVTLYPMYIDMSQFETIYPYDTNSDTYKRYTINKSEYIDTNNPDIKQIAERLWSKSQDNIINYAKLCYEYVAKNYRYLNPNTGIHTIAEILSAGGGDCGNLASIYVNLLRAKQIPARHIVTVRPDGSYHVWADFYLEKYGWIPVDVNMKLDDPQGNYFGYCRGDGIVMSEDICFNVEFISGETYNTVLLQNYLFWYWCISGNNIESYHTVQSKMLTQYQPFSIANIESNNITLYLKQIPGANYYKVNLFGHNNDFIKSIDNIPAENTSLVLDELTSNTKYTIECIPIRIVNNIKTQMDKYPLQFETKESSTTATEVISKRNFAITASKGQINIQLSDIAQVSIFTMTGKCIYNKKSSATMFNIHVPESILIVKITDEQGNIFTEKKNCK